MKILFLDFEYHSNIKGLTHNHHLRLAIKMAFFALLIGVDDLFSGLRKKRGFTTFFFFSGNVCYSVQGEVAAYRQFGGFERNPIRTRRGSSLYRHPRSVIAQRPQAQQYW